MKAASFDYHAPGTLPEAIELLGRLEDARILAGGQSLVPMLNMRFVVTDNLIDINNVAGLAYIREEGGAIAIGAITRQRAVLESETLRQRAPIFAEALHHVGHLPTRNRGTIGGSLCHLDPATELPVVAAAYDAVLTVEGGKGAREIPFADWPAGYMTPALEHGELLTRIRFEPWAPDHGWAFMELARRHGDFALVCVGVLLEVAGGAIARAAIALGGVETRPLHLKEAEEAIMGQPPTLETFAIAADIARRIEAVGDAYTTADYRRKVAGVLVGRALARAAERAGA